MSKKIKRQIYSLSKFREKQRAIKANGAALDIESDLIFAEENANEFGGELLDEPELYDDDFEPVEFSGKPISETIIEERR